MPSKPIQVIKLKDSYNPPTYVAWFSLVTPQSGTIYKEVCAVNSCREVIAENLMVRIKNDGYYTTYKEAIKNVDIPVYNLNRMRILIGIPIENRDNIYSNIYKNESNLHKTLREKMFVIKRVINIYEEYAGFGKTKIFPVKRVFTAKEIKDKYFETKEKHLWLFNAPKGWMFSSQLMSFYMLLMRLGASMEKKHMDALNKETSVDGINKVWSNIVKSCREEKRKYLTRPTETHSNYSVPNPIIPAYFNDIIEHIDASISDDKIKIILKNRRSLFNKTDRFPHRTRVSSGITSLCNYQSHDSGLHKKLRTMIVENNKNK